MKPKVWHIKDSSCPTDAVYIGRPSKWGNPFKIGRDGTRAEVIAKYSMWLHDNANGKQIASEATKELKGRHLSCWCIPFDCHGDVLLELVGDPDEL